MKTRNQHRLEVVQSGYQTGKSLEQIGRELSVSRETVRKIAAKAGLRFRDRALLNPDQHSVIADLWRTGYTKKQISEKTGIYVEKVLRCLPKGKNPNS